MISNPDFQRVEGLLEWLRELRSFEVFCPSEIVSELPSSAAQIPSITL
jgi:hypothetical protein